MVTLALAGALALAGCTGVGSPKAQVGAPAPRSTATSVAQVNSLDDAVAVALAVTPKTPVAEIGQAGTLLKRYTDASSTLTADQKSAADAFLAQSQQAVAAGDAAGAGADLQAAAHGVSQALSGD
ncbi:hypothetical protein GCM10022287_37010 [Gryllotalpicola koreensis]|uniref:Uncharacterized protein n=1 Tax=Gryllotalpicola koreensis TaxID=993086 RepID=A0ABP8ACB6_9MICO